VVPSVFLAKRAKEDAKLAKKSRVIRGSGLNDSLFFFLGALGVPGALGEKE
jgi:hypothetical protein